MQQSQNDRVLALMRSHKCITALDAMQKLGVMRLAARIEELRGLGYVITKQTVKVKNRDDVEVRVAAYSLIETEAKGEAA